MILLINLNTIGLSRIKKSHLPRQEAGSLLQKSDFIIGPPVKIDSLLIELVYTSKDFSVSRLDALQVLTLRHLNEVEGHEHRFNILNDIFSIEPACFNIVIDDCQLLILFIEHVKGEDGCLPEWALEIAGAQQGHFIGADCAFY